MKLWDVSGDGMPWKVKLDVRDLGGWARAGAGTLSGRVREATHGVAAHGALPLGFQVKLGVVGCKYLPAGLHAVEASYVSASSLSSFRAAIVRAVWSCKMPLTNSSAMLDLLDGPVGVDPAYYIAWARFRMMRGFLRWSVMLLGLTLITVGFEWRIGCVVPRLTLRLIWAGVSQRESVMDARRFLLQARTHWYTIILQLHRFMTSISRVSVNHDGRGGMAPDPLVLDQGVGKSIARWVSGVHVNLASLPGSLGFLHGPWVQVHGGCITGADIAAWPYSVGLLCKLISFFFAL